ncbi:MAG: hypothetical protein GY950_18275, partial [bacterium]|nr:hypothetical protein [bacterium]
MMKILIVHDKAIEASKLKLVLAKYGTCEIAPGGNEAIDMSRKAHEAGAPYGFMAVEMDMEEMMGNEVAAAVRMWESEHPDAPKTKFLVILTESDQQMYGLPLDAAGIPQLVKPFNRKKMEEVLQANGLEKKEEPPPPPTPTPKKKAAAPAASAAPKKPVDPEELKRQEAKRKQLEVILNQLKALITDADQLQDIESRQALEELVKKGGKQAQLLMGQYINSPQLPLHTRMELIRSASYIRSPLFLVPLNRVIDTEDNIRLVERALVSISKYSDQRALNILGNALKKIRNPMLLNTVRREVAKIKQDNPVLAILPRFLQSHKSLKTFRVTLDILKKIVTPKDTHLFVNYLRAGNETLELGTFELLCFTGDIAVKDSILVFFEDRITKITCLAQPECDPLYRLVLSMHQYLLQNPLLIDAQLENFKAFFGSINDIRARQLVSSILCHSQKTEALEFVKTVYAEAEDLREWIIEKLAGNLAAVDFLFERYHEGGDFQDKIIASLLKSERGLHYFVDHFFSFELERQEFIIKQLPFSDNPFLVEFIRKIYETKLFSLKSYLLTVIRDNFLFSFKDILFDPAKQRELMFMGDVFLEPLPRLLPISSMWMFFDTISTAAHMSITNMNK